MLRLTILLSLSCLAGSLLTTLTLPRMGGVLRERFSTSRSEARTIRRKLGGSLFGAPTPEVSSYAPPPVFMEPLPKGPMKPLGRPTLSPPSDEGVEMQATDLKPQREPLSPAQTASVDQWLAQYQRTREIGVDYYNLQAESPLATPTKPASRPKAVRSPTPSPTMTEGAMAKANHQDNLWLQQYKRSREIGVGYYNSVATKPRFADEPPAPARKPAVRAPLTQWQEQGLAGTARAAKQQSELDAFRASMATHRLPSR